MVKSAGEGRVAHRRGAALSADGDLLVLDDADDADWHGEPYRQVIGSSLAKPPSSITEDSHRLEIPKLRTRVRFPSPAPRILRRTQASSPHFFGSSLTEEVDQFWEATQSSAARMDPPAIDPPPLSIDLRGHDNYRWT